MTLEQIKQAVLSGKTVCVGSSAYIVIVDKLGQWFIKCLYNSYCIGLTWADGVTLNDNADEFYIKG